MNEDQNMHDDDDEAIERARLRKLSARLRDIGENLVLEGYDDKDGDVSVLAFDMLRADPDTTIDQVRTVLDERKAGL